MGRPVRRHLTGHQEELHGLARRTACIGASGSASRGSIVDGLWSVPRTTASFACIGSSTGQYGCSAGFAGFADLPGQQ